MWVFDEETLSFLQVNDAAVAQYGYTREEFLQMRITDIRPGEDLPALQAFLASDRPPLRQPSIWRHRRKDGMLIHVEIRSHSLEYDGRPAVLVVVQDVSERVQVEIERKRLLEQERQARAEATQARQQLEFLYHTMSTMLADGLDYQRSLGELAGAVVPVLADWCAVDVLDADERLERVAAVHTNPERVALAYQLHQQYPPDPGAPQGAWHVLRTGVPECYEEISNDLLVQAARDEVHLQLLRALGLVSAILVPLVARGRILGVLTLVTAESGRRYKGEDLKLAEDLGQRVGMMIDNARLYQEAQQANATLEQHVQERTAQLEAANRELESFSYSVSHDLRSPLRAIEGFSRILIENDLIGASEKGVDYLQRIRRNALRMGDLIDDLLQFSRLNRKDLQRQTVQPVDLVDQVLEELAAYREGRNVVVTVHPMAPCPADASLLKQVYVNLLANAFKFTRNRDEARIDVGQQPGTEPPVYYVTDNGAGFDMRYADKLFGVFQRLHRSEEYDGTGVGLAIVQRIVHRHGGDVWAEAAVDAGASFFFTLQSAGSNDDG